MSRISSLDAVKIQARAVIPIVKALELELGKIKAHRLVGDAIAGSWATYIVNRQVRSSGSSDHPRDAGNSNFPVQSIIVKDTENEHAINMTKCEYADYFRRIEEPEVGALLTCGVDYAVEKRMRPDWTFSRNQTLMQGAEFCDFCWARKSKGGKA